MKNLVSKNPFLKHFIRKLFYSGIIIAAFCCSFLFFTPISYGSTNNVISSTNPIGSLIQGESNSTSNEWPMFHNSANHTGVTETTPVKGNGPIWTRSFKNEYGTYYGTSSPVVVNGRLYVGSTNNDIICLNATTGILFWKYDTTDVMQKTPAVSYGRVFVVNDLGVYCLNATTGNLLWSYTSVTSTAPTVADGRVFVGSGLNSTFCLNATSGTLLWNYNTNGYITSTPTVAYGRVYVGSYQNNMTYGFQYCLNATSGTLLWNYTTDGSIIETSSVVNNGRLYVGVSFGNIDCFNAISGTFLWNYTTDNFYFTTTPAVTNGRVYVGTESDHLYCLNATSGTFLWREFTDGMSDSPAVANGMVYLATFLKNYTLCFNATSGTQIWNYTTDSEIYSSPAIANGMVYIQSEDGRLYCFPMLLTVHNNSIGGMNLIELSSMVVIGVMIVNISIMPAKKRLK